MHREIGVGIIEYNCPDLTNTAISYAKDRAGIEADYLLVVNSCRTFPSIDGKQFDDIIINKENKGYTKAANQAINHWPDRDIVVLNPDTVPEQDWLKELHRAAYDYPDVKIGMAAPRDENRLLYRGHEGRVCGASFSDCDGTSAPYEGYFQGWFGFACVYFRRDMLDDQGLLNEAHFNYKSDKEYGRKICAAGYHIAHTHASVIHHIVRGSQHKDRRWEALPNDPR